MARRRRSSRVRKASPDPPSAPSADRAAAAAPMSAPDEGAPVHRLWTAIGLGAVGIFSAVYGFREIFSPDIGFYLATGRAIAEAGSIPYHDVLTWTRSDQPYVNLWWLYQTVCWGVWSLADGFGLRLLHLAGTLAVLAIAVERARGRCGRIPLTAGVALLLFALSNLWEVRPHVASWLYLSGVLWVLERDARGVAGRSVWILPGIFVLWINTHALFVLGFVALGAHVVDRWLDPVRRYDLRLPMVGAASLAACLLNPFFLEGLLLPVEQLSIIGSPLFTSAEVGIAEYRHLFDLSGFRRGEHLVLFQPHAFALVYAALAGLGLAGAWRSLRWADALLIVAFGYVFVTAIRNVGFFFLVSFPVVVAGLDAWLARLGAETTKPPGATRLAKRIGASLALVSLVLTGLALEGRLFAWEWSPHRLGSRFNAAILPVDLSEFIVEHEIDGRLLNSWDDGGYLAFATGRKTFIDGRMEVMGENHFRRYLALKNPDEIDAALARFRPDMAVVPHNRIPLWIFTLAYERDWRPVYVDESWALLLRPGFRTDLAEAPLARSIPGKDYPRLERERIREWLEAERSERRRGLREAWQGRASYPLTAVRLTGFHYQRGDPYAATGVGLAALRDTDHQVPDLYLNVGYALLRAGDPENALRSFELFQDSTRVAESRRQVQGVIDRIRRR